MVRLAGIEPAHHFWREILSLLCLPISPQPHDRAGDCSRPNHSYKAVYSWKMEKSREGRHQPPGRWPTITRWPFQPLQNFSLFEQAQIANGTVAAG